PGTQED
ncbi:hypothetical protein BN1723_020751, partial [Verticillium longisporum]